MTEVEVSAEGVSVSTKTLVRVTDIVYKRKNQPSDGTQLTVTVCGRDEHGDRYTADITGIRPYFFGPQQETTPDGPSVVTVDDGYEGFDGTPLNKITTRFPADVSKLRDDYSETYEGDIPFERRVSIDWGLSGYIRVPDGGTITIDQVETDIDPSDVDAIDPRVLMADIEALPPDGNIPFDDFVDYAKGEITAITFYDTGTGETVALVTDPEGKVDGAAVKDHIVDHWDEDEAALRDEVDDEVADALIETFTGPIDLIQCQDEAALLESFICEIENRRPDLLSGWNWIDFDHQYILNRIDQYFPTISEHRLSDIGTVSGRRVAQKIDGLPGFDMMESFCDKMTFSEWRSQRLDFVADEELGVGKVENMSIGAEYRQNRSRFLAYNIIDTQLLVGLDDKHGIHEFFYTLAELSNIQVYDTKSELRLVDGFVMGNRADDEILPTQKEDNIQPPIGGLVLAPSDGIKEFVGVFDLKSLYPSTIITCNISPETMVDNPSRADVTVPMMPAKEDDVGGTITERNIDFDLSDDAIGFSLDREGIIPKYLRRLFKNRAHFKSLRNEFNPNSAEYAVYDNKQGSIKVIMNSFYGVLNNEYYRLAKQGMGDAITSASRYVLWKGSEVVADIGYETIYGDTDSCMFQIVDKDATVELDGDGGATVDNPDEEFVASRDNLIERGSDIEAEMNDKMTEVADSFGIPSEHPYLVDRDLHGTDRHTYKYEYEKLYRRFFQAGTKKRYAGKLWWKEGSKLDKLDITGFEAERADVPVLTEKTQKAVIKKVLDNTDFDALSAYVRETSDGIETRRFDYLPDGVDELWDLATPAALNKPPQQYPNMPVKRATLHANKHLGYEWKEGDDPWLYPIASTPPMTADTDYIALEWGDLIPEGYELDTAKIVEKKFRGPIQPVLDTIGVTWNELQTGGQSQGVDVTSDDTSNPFAGGGARNGVQTAQEASVTDEGTGADPTDDAAEDDATAAEDASDPTDETNDDNTENALSW